MIIGIIIGLANSDSRYGDSQPLAYAFLGATNGAVLGALFGYVIDRIRESTVVKKVAENIENQKAEREINRNVLNSMTNYKDAVHRFQYLSNQTLLEKFQNEETNEVDHMERLALEEEMVKRGLIEFSPMHEQLEKIKDLYK